MMEIGRGAPLRLYYYIRLCWAREDTNMEGRRAKEGQGTGRIYHYIRSLHGVIHSFIHTKNKDGIGD